MRHPFLTVRLEDAAVVTAPDGSRVDILSSTSLGSMARFSLEPGRVSKAVRHRSVEEIWYVICGEGEMWRSCEGKADITPLSAGVSLALIPGTTFQFRNTGNRTLIAISVTMPPWPGMDEAELVTGLWNQSNRRQM